MARAQRRRRRRRCARFSDRRGGGGGRRRPLRQRAVWAQPSRRRGQGRWRRRRWCRGRWRRRRWRLCGRRLRWGWLLGMRLCRRRRCWRRQRRRRRIRRLGRGGRNNGCGSRHRYQIAGWRRGLRCGWRRQQRLHRGYRNLCFLRGGARWFQRRFNGLRLCWWLHDGRLGCGRRWRRRNFYDVTCTWSGGWLHLHWRIVKAIIARGQQPASPAQQRLAWPAPCTQEARALLVVELLRALHDGCDH